MSSLQPYLPVIAQTLTTAFGVLIGASGIRALASTSSFLEHFGLPSDDKTSAEPLNIALVKLASARNIMFGAATVAFQAQGDVRAMGTLFLCGLVISSTDGYVAWNYGSGVSSHFWGTVVSGVLGGYLVWIG